MKVLHLGKFYPPAKGGMETILALICERTAQHVQNRVIVSNSSPSTVEERHGSIEVLRVAALTRIGAVALCPRMPFDLAREDADVIVLHEPNPMALVAYFLARPTGRLIVWYHSDVIRPSWRYRLFYRPFLRFALSRAVRIVVSSPTLGASAPALQDFQAKCKVIPFGIEARIPPIWKRPSQRALRDSARSESADRVVRRPPGAVQGHRRAARGLDGTRCHCADRRRRSAASSARGPGARAWCCRSGSFSWRSDDDELAALYRACNIFVLPSVTRQEAFGVVQLEAMAAGKPVVSTDLGTGVGWVNRDGETGFVVPPRDPSRLRDAIARLLGDTALQKSMGEAAAKRSARPLRVERMIDDTLSLYRDVMATAGHGKTAA